MKKALKITLAIAAGLCLSYCSKGGDPNHSNPQSDKTTKQHTVTHKGRAEIAAEQKTSDQTYKACMNQYEQVKTKGEAIAKQMVKKQPSQAQAKKLEKLMAADFLSMKENVTNCQSAAKTHHDALIPLFIANAAAGNVDGAYDACEEAVKLHVPGAPPICNKSNIKMIIDRIHQLAGEPNVVTDTVEASPAYKACMTKFQEIKTKAKAIEKQILQQPSQDKQLAKQMATTMLSMKGYVKDCQLAAKTHHDALIPLMLADIGAGNVNAAYKACEESLKLHVSNSIPVCNKKSIETVFERLRKWAGTADSAKNQGSFNTCISKHKETVKKIEASRKIKDTKEAEKIATKATLEMRNVSTDCKVAAKTEKREALAALYLAQLANFDKKDANKTCQKINGNKIDCSAEVNKKINNIRKNRTVGQFFLDVFTLKF
jgi:hypothetical protein